jgi:hypothetical protein
VKGGDHSTPRSNATHDGRSHEYREGCDLKGDLEVRLKGMGTAVVDAPHTCPPSIYPLMSDLLKRNDKDRRLAFGSRGSRLDGGGNVRSGQPSCDFLHDGLRGFGMARSG